MNLLFSSVFLIMIKDAVSQSSDDARNKCVDSCFTQPGKPGTPRTQPECIVDVRSISSDCDELMSKNKIDIVQTDTGRYFYSKDKKNWHDASRWCRSMGLQLVGLESQLESQQVTEKILQNGAASDTFWVGGCDHVDNNQWYWVETGEDIIEYKNWDNGEPNIANKKDILRCIMLRGSAFKWVVDDCMNERKFICEMPELCFKPYCTTN